MFDSSFFINAFVVYPIVRRILAWRKDKVPVNTRLGLAILFLALVGILGLVIELYDDWGNNYFEVLGIPHDASLAEVKKAYKAKALEFHPDKNTGQEDMFIRVKEAYNVLLNPESRDVYDKWGEPGLEWLSKEHGSGVVMTGSIQSLIFYVTYATLVFLLTMSSSETNSRAWSYAGLGIVCAIDFGMRFGDLDLPMLFFPSLTVFQQIHILQKLYPSYMHGCIVIQSAVYVDTDQINFEALKLLLKQNHTLLLRLHALEAEMRSAKLIKGTGQQATTVSATDPAAAAGADNLPRNKVAAMRQRASQAAEEAAKVQQETPEKFKVPSWMYMIGLYILFNYVLK